MYHKKKNKRINISKNIYNVVIYLTYLKKTETKTMTGTDIVFTQIYTLNLCAPATEFKPIYGLWAQAQCHVRLIHQTGLEGKHKLILGNVKCKRDEKYMFVINTQKHPRWIFKPSSFSIFFLIFLSVLFCNLFPTKLYS